jgi:hypothetical protein
MWGQALAADITEPHTGLTVFHLVKVSAKLSARSNGLTTLFRNISAIISNHSFLL